MVFFNARSRPARRIVQFSIAVAAVLVSALAPVSAATPAQQEPDDPRVEIDPALAPPPEEDSREAMIADARLIAESQGWRLDETLSHLEEGEAVDRVTVRLWSEHRDVFVGAALGEKPGDPATIYIKGSA